MTAHTYNYGRLFPHQADRIADTAHGQQFLHTAYSG